MGGDPTKQLIAIGLATIALIFFIAAAGVSDWEHTTVAGNTLQAGAFKYTGGGQTYTIYPDCTIHSSQCSGSCGTITPSSTCNQVRAVEGFLILALLFTAIIVIIMCVVRFGGKEVSAVAVHVLLAVAALCALISFAVFVNKLNPPPYVPVPGLTWTLGAGFALTVVGWILLLIDIPVWHMANSGTA